MNDINIGYSNCLRDMKAIILEHSECKSHHKLELENGEYYLVSCLVCVLKEVHKAEDKLKNL